MWKSENISIENAYLLVGLKVVVFANTKKDGSIAYI